MPTVAQERERSEECLASLPVFSRGCLIRVIETVNMSSVRGVFADIGTECVRGVTIHNSSSATAATDIAGSLSCCHFAEPCLETGVGPLRNSTQ